MNFAQFEVMTFDCYGTLIDWETGLLRALRPVLSGHEIELTDEKILEYYAKFETEAESGSYQPYKQVLETVLRAFGRELHFEPTQEQLDEFSTCVRMWPAFPDSARALAELKRKFKLVILSNIDDDLFAFSQEKLGIRFHDVITAEQVGSYKPALRNFKVAIARVGVPKGRILHVAQSLFHDHQPAKELGLKTVWVNRRQGKSGPGATPPAEAKPDFEVPDLQSLVELTRV